MKQARQCLERPFTGQLGYAFTYSFGFVLTKPFSKEKAEKKKKKISLDLSAIRELRLITNSPSALRTKTKRNFQDLQWLPKAGK